MNERCQKWETETSHENVALDPNEESTDALEVKKENKGNKNALKPKPVMCSKKQRETSEGEQ